MRFLTTGVMIGLLIGATQALAGASSENDVSKKHLSGPDGQTSNSTQPGSTTTAPSGATTNTYSDQQKGASGQQQNSTDMPTTTPNKPTTTPKP